LILPLDYISLAIGLSSSG